MAKRVKTKTAKGGNYFAAPAAGVDFITSGCLPLDLALGGGWAERRIANIVGDKCLSGDTIVSVSRGGRLKKMTIATLYQRVHGGHPNSKAGAATYVLSDLGGYVGKHLMVDVRKTGSKLLYEVAAANGAKIRASADHRFLTVDGWSTIADGLSVGSEVYVWSGKKTGREERPNRKVTYSIPYHPNGWQHVIAGRNYKRMLTARLVIEAAMNNLDLDDFIRILRNDPKRASKLAYTSLDLDVHHKNGDPLDDSIDNLELIEPDGHWGKHADDMRRDTNRTTLVKIKSIRKIGKQQTYDISMAAPHHNFIADGFVVHNSTGKTLLCIEACANFAMKYPKGKIRYREAEAAFDKPYAHALGMPVDRVDFGQDEIETVEQLFDDMNAVIKGAKGPELYVVDSLDALSDAAEMERDMNQGSFGASKAKQLSQLFRRTVRKMGNKQITVIIVSQIRDKIGVSFGRKFTRSGGKALDFYASQAVYLAHIGQVHRTVKGVKRATGVHIRAKLDKNKIGLPFREAQFPILFGYGVDDFTACLEYLDEAKLLKEAGYAKSGIASAFRAIQKESREAEAAELARLHKLVRRHWRETEVSLLPTRKKYG